MANIAAADVKKLRELTGAGMLDCKKALEEADGDLDRAIEIVRVKFNAKLPKRGERVASNGLVAAAEGAMIELASETDFVAKNDQFQSLANDIVTHFAGSSATDTESLLAERLADGKTVSENIDALAGVMGEKLELRRVVKLSPADGHIATYLHKRASDLPPQVGVLVQFAGDDVTVARGAAMQIAAMRPRYLSRADVPEDTIENERRIAEATAREEGKPEQALARIVEGRLNGFFKDTVLLEQPSVQDAKRTVQALLDEAGVTITRFVHFEIGAS
jgi:elongation factor Ts